MRERELAFFPHLPLALPTAGSGAANGPAVACPCPGHGGAISDNGVAMCSYDDPCEPFLEVEDEWAHASADTRRNCEEPDLTKPYPCSFCKGEGLVRADDFEFYDAIVKEGTP